ncbi:hypothetical protein ACFPC0_11575 [Streptomyces andamanensis]|uniref:Uncharacterized protein n=1 Tax=Streptomyces andamanensis TaxID=1565035 RepID=A0ABV8TCY7_9ACTN
MLFSFRVDLLPHSAAFLAVVVLGIVLVRSQGDPAAAEWMEAVCPLLAGWGIASVTSRPPTDRRHGTAGAS